jgi:hypothetical protein
MWATIAACWLVVILMIVALQFVTGGDVLE